MARVVADITISLDGFVTGPKPGPGAGLGEGGEPLHHWAMRPDPVDADILDQAVAATGAVIMGRRLFDVVDGPHGWNEDRGYGAGHNTEPPVLVVTSTPPDRVRLTDRFTFVIDGLSGAIAKGAALAGDRDVVIMGGGETIRSALDAGLVHELRLHIAPVLLGNGTPLFDGLSSRRLHQVHARGSGQAIHVTYRVE
ncbi:dihydrofolate reductase [Actinoplanes lutulentus]|uniref:Dihydrofolate reductase n=1 Tax=Actinoplanes lutulentus TaxID=1287878 RepID=A0A327ZB37_9ACTN|nr:dihydrofolate reductase family protein [Actinoplanes lutulentus]MBB2941426.1 dihydrofolate reductase [Actinoplanes lutulentus]RAK36917.1 dihydrofolate reductase [Actinoplanes lutulentus]